MVSLRRVSLPVKGTERLRRAVFKPRPPRLGKGERKLEEALEQLRSGVPLNWLQMEDDPEIVTLSRLYGIARQAYAPGVDELPPGLQANTLERLSKRLPAPKQQVKQAPRSLAGFSENVPVLTQTEEDLPQLVTTAPQVIVSVLVTALLVTLLAVAYNTFFPAARSPYTWIEMRQNGSVVAAPNLPRGYKMPNCPATVVTDTVPFVLRHYTDFTDPQKAQENVDFPLQYLPSSLTVGSTFYGLGMVGTAISPCDELGSVPYSSARLTYLARSTPSQGSFQLGQVTVFYVRQQVVPVDSGISTFKQVTIGGHRGVFWESESYRDYSGTLWLAQGTISVLVVEKGDIVATFVGQKDKGITEEMLTTLAQTMFADTSPPGTPQASQPSPTTPSGTPSSNIALPIQNKRVPR
ncbi:MAG TPA: hypothetical protein VF914_08720 [Chloroflexia bacterium]